MERIAIYIYTKRGNEIRKDIMVKRRRIKFKVDIENLLYSRRIYYGTNIYNLFGFFVGLVVCDGDINEWY